MFSKPLHSSEYKTLVVLLKQVRREAELTQVEMANRLGVEQSLISKVERCERRLDITELRAFCIAVGIGLSDFVLRFEAALTAQIQGIKNDSGYVGVDKKIPD